MKRWFLFFAAVILVLMLAAAASAENTDVTAERWLAATGMSIEFRADGTAAVTYPSGNAETVPWEQEGNIVSYYYEYELFGIRQKLYYRYLLGETDGHPQLVAEKKNVILYPETMMKELLEQASNAEIRYTETAFGAKLETGFFEMTPAMSAASGKMAAPSGMGTSRTPQKEGGTMFYITGSCCNTGFEEICISAMYVTFDFGEGRVYPGYPYVDAGENGLQEDLAALCDGTVYLGAEVPKDILKSAESCRIRLDFDEGMKLIPACPQAAGYHYEIVMKKEDIRAQAMPEKYEMVYFKEFPSLPMPGSYAGLYTVSSSSSSVNKKLKRAEYKFKAKDSELNLKDVAEKYIKEIKALGFTVKKSGSKWTIQKGKKKMFTFTIEGSQMVFKYGK